MVGVSKVLKATSIILVTLVMMTVYLKKLDRNLVRSIWLPFQLELTVQGWHLFPFVDSQSFLKSDYVESLLLIISVLEVG